MPDPAAFLFAFEFNESKETGDNRFISPLGEIFGTVNIAGALTGVKISPSSGNVHARVSDPTGVFLVVAERREFGVCRFLKDAEIPSLVSVTGRVFPGEPLRISPEATIPVTPDMRNSWINFTARGTIGRMDKAASEGSVNMKDLCRYTDYLERAIDAALVPVSLEEPGIPEDFTGRVRKIIAENSGKKGIAIDELTKICISSGVTESAVKRSIESLLDEGDCYLPSGGYVRLL